MRSVYVLLLVVVVFLLLGFIVVDAKFPSNSVEKPNKETCEQIEEKMITSQFEKGSYWIPLLAGEAQMGAQDVFGKSPFSYKTYEPLKREKMAFSLFKNEYGWIRVSKEGKIGWVVEDSGCTIKIK